jgi:hypothetical protein
MPTVCRDRSVIQYASPDFDNTYRTVCAINAAVFILDCTIKVFPLKKYYYIANIGYLVLGYITLRYKMLHCEQTVMLPENAFHCLWL